MPENDKQRLADLLLQPEETLDIELKEWMDTSDNSHRAKIAKELIALANHGSSYLIFGFLDATLEPDPSYPESLKSYNIDVINGIVARYSEPVFHCHVYHIEHPSTRETHCIVRVPGGHTVPIRAKRDGPNDEIKQNLYYIRRPGPNSEPPQSGREWDELINRCIQNRKEEMLDGIRGILTFGQSTVAQLPTDLEALEAWEENSYERWQAVIEESPPESPARFPHGHYRVSYAILGDIRRESLTQLKETLDRSVARFSGWPPFWVPTRNEIRPYPHKDAIECWIKPDGSAFDDAAHLDFWRISAEGRAFLMRGFQEDTKSDKPSREAGTLLDVGIPIYRMAECLLHAEKLATNLGAGDNAEILFKSHYEGLKGRTLTSLSGRYRVFDGRVSYQNSFENTIQATLPQIRNNLPELLVELLTPLYEMFDFFEINVDFTSKILDELKGNAR